MTGFTTRFPVGEIVQRHRVPHAQLRHPLKQVALDGLGMGHQCIRGTVEPHQAQALEVHPEQLAETAAVCQWQPRACENSTCHHGERAGLVCWDMAHISGDDRSQQLLLPDAVDDWVGADNPVRFIDAFVDGLDLERAGFERVQ